MSKKKSDSSSNPTDPIGVIALWDSENARLPEGYEIKNLTTFIELALKKHDDRFYLKEITAFAPKKPRNPLPPNIKFEEVKRENIRCEAAEPKPKDCYRFIVTDDKNNEEKIMRNTDAADLQMYIAMSMKILKKESHILIISGDSDFLTFVKRFSSKLYFMLAINEDSDHERLDTATKATWLWTSSDKNVGTMVRGGVPTHEN
ncbi:hypothetical protein Bca4012_024728 [Brassica carinata]